MFRLFAGRGSRCPKQKRRPAKPDALIVATPKLKRQLPEKPEECFLKAALRPAG